MVSESSHIGLVNEIQIQEFKPDAVCLDGDIESVRVNDGGKVYWGGWIRSIEEAEKLSTKFWQLGYEVLSRDRIFGSISTPMVASYKLRYSPMAKGKPLTIEKALAINGWMSERELFWLAYQASKHEKIVELGSFRGRSTRALADNTQGFVVAIDNWYGPLTVSMRDSERETLFSEFVRNMGDLIETGKVIVKKEDHRKADVDFTPDMVFVDGSHSYDDAKADVLKWREKVDGLLCGHDATKFDLPQVLSDVFGSDYEIVPGTDIWVCS